MSRLFTSVNQVKNIGAWTSLEVYDFKSLKIEPGNLHFRTDVRIFTQFDIRKTYLLNNFCVFSKKNPQN